MKRTPRPDRQRPFRHPKLRRFRLTPAILPMAALAVLCALVATLAVPTAQAQNAIWLKAEKGTHPVSYSTANGRACPMYQITATGVPSGRTHPFARNSGNDGAPIAIDVSWSWPALRDAQGNVQSGVWHGFGGPPSDSEGFLMGKLRDGDWYWNRTLCYISAAEDRPRIATINLSSPSNSFQVSSSNQHQIAINPQIAVYGAQATEGDHSHLEFKVLLLPSALETVTVDYATSARSATAGTDYTETSGTLTFSVGDKEKTIRVPIVDDSVSDGGETLALTLSNPSGVTRLVKKLGGFYWSRPGGGGEPRYIRTEFATTVSVTGTIYNDEPGPNPSVDDLPLVAIHADDSYAGEGSEAVFTLTRTGDTSEALTAAVSVRESGDMLGASVPTHATFTAGERETELRVSTVDDDAVEDDSTVTVTFQPRSGYRLGTNPMLEATVIVLDNDEDAPPDPTPASPGVEVWSADMSVMDYGTGAIGAGSADLLSNHAGSEGIEARTLWYYGPNHKLYMTFTDPLDTSELKLYAGNVALGFPTSGDADFTWKGVDPVDWADGQTVAVRLVRGEKEASASADATLRSLVVSNAELTPVFDSGTLLYSGAVDPDTASVTVSAVASDDDAEVTFALPRDADSEQSGHQVAVPYGETLIAATVTAADGETQRLYRVVVKRPLPSVALTVTVWFEAAAYTATEGAGPAPVVVQLSTDPGEDVTIPLTATPGGGAVEQDYSVPESVTFTSGGPMSQTVWVTAVSDDTAEECEYVVLGFGSLPERVQASGTTNATVALLDGDAAPQPVNVPATGAPTITGTARVGETLTAVTSGIADENGLDNATFSYKWIANDGITDTEIVGATDISYALSGSDLGKTVKVRVSFTDDAGHQENLTSQPIGPVDHGVSEQRSNNSPTGAPTITGTAQVGETLTADTSEIADGDGLEDATFSYQWIAGDLDISGATDSTYTLVLAEQGSAIKVRVSFTDDAGNEETLTSEATSAVKARPNRPATGVPTITGTAQVGETLTIDTSDISDEDGIDKALFNYHWLADGEVVSNYVWLVNVDDVDESNRYTLGTTYTLMEADEGKTIKVRVNFTDDAGNEESVTSAATSTVEAAPNTPATGSPTIAGTAQVGETLTAGVSGIADDDGLENASFSYQWLADDTAITGATEQTYSLDDTEEGKVIKVRVTFSDDRGNPETLTSAATVAVEGRPNSPATGQPTITGNALVGETLKAGTSDITDEDGLTNASFSYQWISNYGGADSDIVDATGSQYIIESDDVGKTIKVRVSFNDDRNNAETLTSDATGAVAGLPPPPLTAGLENTPTGHNGTDAFTFEIQFSEDVKLSYKTLRDHSLTVTGGTVKKAKRLEQGSNIRWRITVEPDSSVDLTVVLPVTTDCDDTGAVCTKDGGRPLSNRLEFTVRGPGQ